MMDLDMLMEGRQDPAALAGALAPSDIPFLVMLLGEKNNDIRYAAFLTLKERSIGHGDVYPYWDALEEKLRHENSYQRSIGVMLLAENVRWDRDNRLDGTLCAYISLFQDEKFITARQAIQSLLVWLPQKPDMYAAVLLGLTAIRVDMLPQTQQKLILKDVLQVMMAMQPFSPCEAATAYACMALQGGLLDKKEKEALRRRMGV